MDDTPSTAERATILAVNHQDAVRELIALIAAKLEYQLIFGDDPETAIQLARTKHPEAIIINPLYPDWGVDVCWELQSNPPTNEIPMICLASLGCVGWDVVLAELRFAAIFTLPFKPVELVEALQDVLRTPARKLPKLKINFNKMGERGPTSSWLQAKRNKKI